MVRGIKSSTYSGRRRYRFYGRHCRLVPVVCSAAVITEEDFYSATNQYNKKAVKPEWHLVGRIYVRQSATHNTVICSVIVTAVGKFLTYNIIYRYMSGSLPVYLE